MEFSYTKIAHTFLEDLGFTRRERYRMLKGEIIRDYSIIR